jgi:hypothetical protein
VPDHPLVGVKMHTNDAVKKYKMLALILVKRTYELFSYFYVYSAT